MYTTIKFCVVAKVFKKSDHAKLKNQASLYL